MTNYVDFDRLSHVGANRVGTNEVVLQVAILFTDKRRCKLSLNYLIYNPYVSTLVVMCTRCQCRMFEYVFSLLVF